MLNNHSILSVKVADLIKNELILEGQFDADVVNIVVDNFNLEERGLATIVAELASIVKTVQGGH